MDKKRKHKKKQTYQESIDEQEENLNRFEEMGGLI
jgi:hypothetical protein